MSRPVVLEKCVAERHTVCYSNIDMQGLYMFRPKSSWNGSLQVHIMVRSFESVISRHVSPQYTIVLTGKNTDSNLSRAAMKCAFRYTAALPLLLAMVSCRIIFHQIM